MMLITRAYRYALDPTPTQEREFASHVGASRLTYNYLLSKVKSTLDQREAEKSYGVPESELTPYMPTSHYALRKYWNTQKELVAPWYRENSKEAYSDGAKRLSLSLSNWFASIKGKRKGAKVGFPKYHKRGRHESVRFTTGNIGVTTDRHHILLPVIGEVRTHESTRKLARRVENDTARILAATLSRSGNRWFVTFTCEVEVALVPTRTPMNIVGVDLGLKTLYKVVDVDGNTVLDITNPKQTKQSEVKLRRAQRLTSRKQGPNSTVGVKASNRWVKSNKRVTNIHREIANRRLDLINKTTTHLAKTCDVIVVESLNVSGMVRNPHLSKAISDAAWGEFTRQLKYKTTWYGSTLIQADPFFPSSKTCSGCGVAKAKLLLSEREFACTNCGLVIDRDENAAVNLAKLGLVVIAESDSGTGRGGKCKSKGSSEPNAIAVEPSILKQSLRVA